MTISLTTASTTPLKQSIIVTGSKSESNRLLLLQALYPQITIENVSNSDDAQVMQQGITKSSGVVDIHHAGTAMRFLTAYFASQEGKEVVLTGSQRMTERPIKVLVEALNALGADISYEGTPGFPPLRIKGKKFDKSEVHLPADVSSQYISALLLIAPKLPKGLTLHLVGKITSVPYIKMTLALLSAIGVQTDFSGNTITVAPKVVIDACTLVVESDWSSASYFYSIVALSAVHSSVTISSYKKDSLQGDSVLASIYRHFGVISSFDGHTLTLTKSAIRPTTHLELDLANAPDIAQTIAVTCFAMGIGCHLTGLHTLKIKETDRLEALKAELSKFGAVISVDDKTLTLAAGTTIKSDVSVATYNDHRMAMAFAPLALKTSLSIQDAGVVSKSYPDFWTDMKRVNIAIENT